MLAHSPRIITDGMVLCLDAANPRNFNLTAVEVLVVAGGGGGGGWGGGGGAGGLIYNSNFAVTPGTQLTVTIGLGGGGGTTSYTSGGDGSTSVFGALEAIGGGGGGHYPGVSGRNGGSGGGGGGNEGSSVQPGGTGTSGQGFSGGTSNSRNDGYYWGAGGGGGASEDGKNAVGLQGGNGGNGLSFNISGTSQFYAGGGGGHTPNAPGTAITTVGGLGGGGAGGQYYQSITAVSGTSNTGGGGGGGYAGAAGGSGIIIVRYPGPQKAIGGTVTSVNGDTIHTFTTSGNFTPLVNTNGSAVLGLSDLSGNRNFGDSGGSGVLYSSANGGSLSFDGSDDKVVDSSFNSHQINAGTLEWWIKTPASFTDGRYFGGVGGTETYGATRALRIYYNMFSFVSYGSATEDWNSIFAPTINTWYHIAQIWNGTSLTAYFNNISYSATRTGLVTPIGTVLSLGANPWSLNENTSGQISVVRLYNRALSAAEVSQNFNALRGRFGL